MGKLSEAEKERQHQAELARLKTSLLEDNPSFDPDLVAKPRVQLVSPGGPSRPPAPSEKHRVLGPVGNEPAESKPPEDKPLARASGGTSEFASNRNYNGDGDNDVRLLEGDGSSPTATAAPLKANAASLAAKAAPPRESGAFSAPPDGETGAASVPIPQSPEKRAAKAPEALLDRVLRYARPQDATRSNVRVVGPVFNAVTDYSLAHGLDKMQVVSALLEFFVPKQPVEAPKYLAEEPIDGARNRDLTYIEHPDLTARLDRVCAILGAAKADLIESIILHHLPAARTEYRPRRRKKRRRRR